MAFEKVVPEWLAEGTEPPQSLKESGFVAGYKPPADYFNWYMRGTSEALKELQENAGLAIVYVTLSGNADDGYSIDKTFAEIMAAYNAGNPVLLIEHAYGSIVEYKLQYVYVDQIDFSYHKGINHTVIEVYSHGVVTRKNYQYFSGSNPPRCDDIGALSTTGGSVNGELIIDTTGSHLTLDHPSAKGRYGQLDYSYDGVLSLKNKEGTGNDYVMLKVYPETSEGLNLLRLFCLRDGSQTVYEVLHSGNVADFAATADHTHAPADIGAAASSHNQAASTITAGTFAGQVVANGSGQAAGTSLLRNSKLVSADTNPTVNGEICWTYK